MLALLSMTTLPIALRTACASAAGSLWRVAITPIDTLKTTLQALPAHLFGDLKPSLSRRSTRAHTSPSFLAWQVQGSEAYDQVMAKVKTDGLAVLYQGALANALASFVGSYPWCATTERDYLLMTS